MSHTLEAKLKLTNRPALIAACGTLNLQTLGEGTHKLYQRHEKGFGVMLPNWDLPVVVNGDGAALYDNYNGSWGDISELRKLETEYTRHTILESMPGISLAALEVVHDGELSHILINV